MQLKKKLKNFKNLMNKYYCEINDNHYQLFDTPTEKNNFEKEKKQRAKQFISKMYPRSGSREGAHITLEGKFCIYSNVKIDDQIIPFLVSENNGDNTYKLGYFRMPPYKKKLKKQSCLCFCCS